MALTPQLQLRQKQTLKLTQSLLQSIEVMQLDKDEIEALIQKEKEENPLLSLDEEQGEVIIEEKLETTLDVSEALSTSQTQELLDQDEDYNNEYDKEASSNATYIPLLSGGIYASAVDAGSVIEATYAYKASFYEEVETQIRLSFASKKDRAIALFWLSQLDEQGRLPLKAYNSAKKLNDDEASLLFLLDRLQQLEPVGLFARNLQECLKAQLIDQGKWNNIWQDIFAHLKKISPKNIKNIASQIGITIEELTQKLRYLKNLNPYPAWQGEAAETKMVTPELIVQRYADGEWGIELNEEAFNPVVLNELAFLQKQKIEAAWLKHQQQKGQQLLQMLVRRAESILKVGQIILQEQVLFFEKGEDYLRPLTMNSLTEALNMHESTISRLVRHKYLYFEGKSIELRWFFQSARIPSAYGADVSAKVVQMRMRQIIDTEAPQRPYSDDKIAQILEENYGYKLARRTVLKYREALDIPSSFDRKRKYKNQI